MSNKLAQALRSVLEWPLPQGTVESYSLPKWLAHDARAALAEHDATPQTAACGGDELQRLIDAWEVVRVATPAQPVLTDEQIASLARTHLSSMKRPFYTKWKDGIDIEYPTIEVERFARAILAGGKTP